jgi:hypothetical protein
MDAKPVDGCGTAAGRTYCHPDSIIHPMSIIVVNKTERVGEQQFRALNDRLTSFQLQ